MRRIDGHLDRLHLHSNVEAGEAGAFSVQDAQKPAVSSRIAHLQSLIKSLSTTATPKHPLIPTTRISRILNAANISSTCSTCQSLEVLDINVVEEEEGPGTSYEHELEWLLISKATAQAYGQVLSTILDQTLPLGEDIFYWDDILSSYRYAGLYSIQTSPLRLWDWSKDIYHDVVERGGIASGWQQFYKLVRDVAREKSLANLQKHVISPLARVRTEARRNQNALKRLRLMNANALGVLLGEGLSKENTQDEAIRTAASDFGISQYKHKWKNTIAKNIALMEAILQNAMDSELQVDKFDDAIASSTHEDPLYENRSAEVESGTASLKLAAVSSRLQNLLTSRLAEYTAKSRASARSYAKPSRLVRLWLPLSIGLVFSTTILQILTRRRAEILTWIRELGATSIDFWVNWVVDPIKKVIGTIRHDESSEVSIMSKRSLEGDRDSLERMVVAFAKDDADNGTLSSEQLESIRLKVHEGDLTPVLKAYERDMQHPFFGAIRGRLIQALLIQVQKTKVDVEIAMGGIDSLLKSQELVFGFVSLTPGLLVCVGVARWVNNFFGNRKGNQKGKQQTQLVRMLR